MLGNITNILTEEESVSNIKQEYEEEDFMEIESNLKLEKQTAEDIDTFYEDIQTKDESHQIENFVSVLGGAESTIDVKTEIEEDPLSLLDDSNK